MATVSDGGDAVLRAVSAAVPRLRAIGREVEERRWLTDESIALLEEAGVFRIVTPARFGGLELPLADRLRILAEVSRGCSSTGWAVTVWVYTTWLATLFPDEVRKEIFARPSVRVSGVAPAPRGSITPVKDGFVLNGSWRFNTGCRGADWNLMSTSLEQPDGTCETVVAAVPMSEFSVADDWHTSAGCGTGSSTSTAEDLFVPAHRVVPGGVMRGLAVPGRTRDAAVGRDYGVTPLIAAKMSAAFVGIARGALDLFLAGPGHPGGGAAAPRDDQARHPLTQIRVASAAHRITAAGALMDRWAPVLQARADAGEQPTPEEGATVHGEAVYAARLAREAVEILYRESGPSVIHRDVPLQRFFRDIEGFALHPFFKDGFGPEAQGRLLLGLGPGTPRP
ncbi:acyl-CoA dehydrogenase family protein [Streptomyces marincola]|uniref:Uncharacterized protein n=1 Tax=Streptomyces marincola TaxID=2878388 RepID=A0A1W7CVQ1_9ACTN|nr:acyl-CoA dehydrogenase family protein [Streptomyces marincola]ARQ68822.1 hypothetical protein CAG99_08060 [Streptomyces marincola]